MATKKEDKPSACCATAASDSKLTGSVEKLEIKDKEGEKEPENEAAGLDSVLSGGCSICGSNDHDDDDCEDDADPMYMMSTALPPSTKTSSMSTGNGGHIKQHSGKKTCSK